MVRETTSQRKFPLNVAVNSNVDCPHPIFSRAYQTSNLFFPKMKFPTGPRINNGMSGAAAFV
ncbi:hypothetical protein LR48_Vigan2335s000100 [Vigna angularis]|nr:hypothetical protein LR48_Vigan2335s000100 [Vigna angularis]